MTFRHVCKLVFLKRRVSRSSTEWVFNTCSLSACLLASSPPSPAVWPGALFVYVLLSRWLLCTLGKQLPVCSQSLVFIKSNSESRHWWGSPWGADLWDTSDVPFNYHTVFPLCFMDTKECPERNKPTKSKHLSVREHTEPTPTSTVPASRLPPVSCSDGEMTPWCGQTAAANDERSEEVTSCSDTRGQRSTAGSLMHNSPFQ